MLSCVSIRQHLSPTNRCVPEVCQAAWGRRHLQRGSPYSCGCYLPEEGSALETGIETWVSLRSREGLTGEREGRVELGLERQRHLSPCSEGRGNARAKMQVCRATAKEQKGR